MNKFDEKEAFEEFMSMDFNQFKKYVKGAEFNKLNSMMLLCLRMENGLENMLDKVLLRGRLNLMEKELKKKFKEGYR